MIHDFHERLAFSKGRRCDTDKETILAMLDKCVSVESASESLDRMGVDYIATLEGGIEVYVDAKTRSAGCSKWWDRWPELAIEIWSVVPENGNKGKIGWTVDYLKLTHYILYTWAEEDSDLALLVPFQTLRVASRRNCREWMELFKVDTQDSGRWRSKAIFVPWPVVRDAMIEVIEGMVAS